MSTAVPAAALVVGGGFIGSHVARGLARRDVLTTVLTRTSPDARTRARIGECQLIVGNASDSGLLEQAVEDVDCVVWCAGGLLPAESNRRPAEDVVAQLEPLLVMLERLAHREGTRIVFVSSGGTVYGNPSVLPVPENYLPRPRTSHGVTRLAAEHYLGLYRDVYGVPTVALRCANVYGEGQRADRSQGVVAATLARVRRGVSVPLFGDGSSIRDYIYIDDVVDALIGLLTHPDLPGVINLGTGVGTSLTELLELIEVVTGQSFEIERYPARPGDVGAVVLDVSLLESLIRFEPITLHDGLVQSWEALVDSEPVP